MAKLSGKTSKTIWRFMALEVAATSLFGCFSSNNSSRCNKLENFSVTFRRAGTFGTPTMLSRNFERWKKICRQYLPMPMPCSPLALTMPPPSTCLRTNAKTRTTITVCRGKICLEKVLHCLNLNHKDSLFELKKVTWGQLASLLFFLVKGLGQTCFEASLKEVFGEQKTRSRVNGLGQACLSKCSIGFGASLLVQVFYRVWGKLACPWFKTIIETV